jgi:hypothetical protein
VTGERVQYVEAAQAGRAAIARAWDARLSSIEWKVFAAVLGLVTLYSRTSDSIGSRQLAELVYGVEESSGYQRDRCQRALVSLHEKSVLTVETGRGRFNRSLVSIQSVMPCDQSVDTDGTQSVNTGGRNPSTRVGRIRRHGWATPGRSPGSSSEKLPEETDREERSADGASGSQERPGASARRATKRKVRSRTAPSDFSDIPPGVFGSAREAADDARRRKGQR